MADAMTGRVLRMRAMGVAMLLGLAAPLAAQETGAPEVPSFEAPAQAPQPEADSGTDAPGTEATPPATADPAPAQAEAPSDPGASQADPGADAGPQGAETTANPQPAEETPAPAERATPPPPPTALEWVQRFLLDGGPAIWAIAALSVITLAVILWKIWRFVLAGAWSRRASLEAVKDWEAGSRDAALARVSARKGMRSRFVTGTMQAIRARPAAAAREEATRLARDTLERAGTGLRALELIATIAPLLGLLGTVLGMIEAFRQLQEAGSGADPSQLAGGIWEALLTTAAGMAVAIPASAALTWFEAVIARVRHDMESMAARLFVAESGAGESESS